MPRKEISPQHKEILVTIGVRLKKIREEKGYTIQFIADELHMSRNGYSLMERGEIYFNVSTLFEILDFYNTDHIEFFRGL